MKMEINPLRFFKKNKVGITYKPELRIEPDGIIKVSEELQSSATRDAKKQN